MPEMLTDHVFLGGNVGVTKFTLFGRQILGIDVTLHGMNSYHRYKELGESLNYLVECWARGWSTDPVEKEQYDWACMVPVDDAREEPERAWNFILLAIKVPICEPHLGVLASGPLEDLLSYHGAQYIGRIETLAKENPKFAHMLGGVWQFQMTEEVWSRVQKVWDPRGRRETGDAV